MRVFLIRHGESQANVDGKVRQSIPDHDIALSSRGMEQAQEAGHLLKRFLKENPPQPGTNQAAQQMAQQLMGNLFKLAGQSGHDLGQLQSDMFKARLWNSPYRRVRETARIIGGVIQEHVLDTKEDVLLCEQQFGLFDGIPPEEQAEKFPNESKCFEHNRSQNGKFWARFPQGESAFDTACRLRQFFGTIKRDEENGIHDHIIVCHGTVLKLFTMMWMHYKYEWFGAEPSPGNCAIRLIDRGSERGYVDKGYIFGGHRNGKAWRYDGNKFKE